MDLEIVKVELEGNEYIALKASRACDLTSYVIKDSTYKNIGGKRIISNKRTNTFWFSDHYQEYIVNAGDYIFLFTGHGKYSWFYNNVGTTTHNFFWNLDVEVWNNTGDYAHLVKIENSKKCWLVLKQFNK